MSFPCDTLNKKLDATWAHRLSLSLTHTHRWTDDKRCSGSFEYQRGRALACQGNLLRHVPVITQQWNTRGHAGFVKDHRRVWRRRKQVKELEDRYERQEEKKKARISGMNEEKKRQYLLLPWSVFLELNIFYYTSISIPMYVWWKATELSTVKIRSWTRLNEHHFSLSLLVYSLVPSEVR